MNDRNKKINIAVVDDHNLFRKGLIKLINLGDSRNRYDIAFEAQTGVELKEKIDKKNPPDIVLMDINMPDMDGFEAADWLHKYYPDINVLVVSMLESEEAILRMIRLGVKGYLSKDIEVEDIHSALEAISNKGYYYSDFVAGIMAHSIQQNRIVDNGDLKLSTNLSENEREFIGLACTDLTYHQIADKMNLSPKTIDGYRESLFKKFNVKSRVGLAMYAVKNDLIRIGGKK